MVAERVSTQTLSARAAPWVAWSAWVLSVVLVTFSGLLLILNRHVEDPAAPYWSILAAGALGFSTVGAFVASKRRENLMGWLFGIVGLLYGAAAFAGEYGTYALFTDPGSSLPGGVVAFWLGSWLWIPGGSSILFSFLLFPHGRLPSSRWRPVAWLAASTICLATVSFALMPGPLEGISSSSPVDNPFGIEGAADLLDLVKTISMPLLGVTALVSATAVFVRFRRAKGDEREQFKWVCYAVAVLAVAGAASSFSEAIDHSLFGRMLILIGFLAIPAAIGVAIFKYRLYDIDLVINRTLVYGALTACVIGIYVFVVGYLGALFRTGGSLAISLVATGLVAVLFQPLRDRLQRGVNRLMYGERDDPYRVISRLGERLKATDAPEAVLPTIVETVAGALKLPHAEISSRRDDGTFGTVATSGHPRGEPLVLPLSYGTETIGRLVLSPRAPGEMFDPADRRLLDGIARYAEAAVYAVRLTADLQRSRERLVNAREEERRRLRRDLHDGLGPQLAALTLKLDAARNLVSQEPEAADALLTELKTTTKAAISDIRRLVYDLRPPALDELGLIPAIREQATNYGQNGLDISVGAPKELPPLPAAVEVAAYRIVQEALTNVIRHARARACRIRLSVDHELELEITDDGVGLSEERRAGVGLSSMRERAAELGGTCVVESAPTGGTRVLARLPLPDTEATDFWQQASGTNEDPKAGA